MEDYEKLYKQSQIQIKKQKQQIRKFQEEIRERCQSYLIHSSRYRSRGGLGEKSNQKSQSNQVVSESSSISQGDINQNNIQSNVVDVVFDFQNFKQSGIDEQTETIQVVQQEQGNYKTNASNGRMPAEFFADNQPQAETISYTNGPTKRESLPKEAQQIIQQNQNNNSNIFWEEVIAGLNDRMGALQKQKAEQAQKIIDLEQEIKNYKKQQKQWTESAMKKKQGKSIQYSSDQKEGVNSVAEFSPAQEFMTKLAKNFEGYVDFNNCTNVDEKIDRITSYVAQLNEKIKTRQNKGNQQFSLKQSKVYDYNFSTPYRKIKESNSKEIEMRDTYQQNEIEMLRKKCQQLQMELTKSRNLKEQSPLLKQQIPPSTDNIEEEQQQIVNQPPYLIEEELQKPNNPFVKRSFVRKKVVKRNLSAMILRSPSKSKQESKAAMINQLEKLKTHLQKSRDGNNEREILSLSKKINKLEHHIEEKQQKIDEISDDGSSLARASGVSQDNFTQIIQVETEGPGFRNYTAHILGLNKKDNSERRKKENFYA